MYNLLSDLRYAKYVFASMDIIRLFSVIVEYFTPKNFIQKTKVKLVKDRKSFPSLLVVLKIILAPEVPEGVFKKYNFLASLHSLY